MALLGNTAATAVGIALIVLGLLAYVPSVPAALTWVIAGVVAILVGWYADKK